MIRSTQPVTPDDLDLAVRLAVDTLRAAPEAGWDQPAGSLEWTCWETAEHLADDLFSYAAQIGPRTPPLEREVPFSWTRTRAGGPANAIGVDRAAGPAGMLQVLETTGALLVAMARCTPPQVRAHHIFGISDPEGFTAMGIVEILAHTHDLAEGFGLPWAPPAELCERVLARLFPDSPADAEPWPALLWCTGRGELPGRPRLTKWRWNGVPAAER
nr:maleylpyruvate isomerase N-terminal domain-containing protein [Kitasatospora gansuensis]